MLDGGGNYGNSIISNVYAFIMSFAGCLSFISLFFLLEDTFNKKYMLKTGQSTLGIYAVHYLLIDVLVSSLKLNGNVVIAIVGTFCVILLSLFVIAFIRQNIVLSFLLLGIKNEKR